MSGWKNQSKLCQVSLAVLVTEVVINVITFITYETGLVTQTIPMAAHVVMLTILGIISVAALGCSTLLFREWWKMRRPQVT